MVPARKNVDLTQHQPQTRKVMVGVIDCLLVFMAYMMFAFCCEKKGFLKKINLGGRVFLVVLVSFIKQQMSA